MALTLVNLCDVLLNDQGTQARAALSELAVQEYAEVLYGGGKLPPLDLFPDGMGSYWVGDGWHRSLAYRLAKVKVVEARLHNGGRPAAVLFACRANERHGLRKTPADRRRAVHLLLTDPDWAGRSAAWVAEACGVGVNDVLRARKETGVVPPHLETRNGNCVKNRATGPPEPVLLDPLGQPVPEALSQAFRDAAVLRAARRASERAATMECLSGEAKSALALWLEALAGCEPAAVCPDCSGLGCEGRPCGGRGWVSVAGYDKLRPGQRRKCERFK